jgi:hypothetical protein
MATYYLINTVQVGLNRLFAGTLIDSTVDDTTAIESAGGVLVDSSEATVAAAAAKAQALRLQGKPVEAIDSLMLAARNQSLDTVGNTTAVNAAATGVNQNATGVNQNATGVNQNATAVNQDQTTRRHEFFYNPEAPATSYGTLADDAASANPTGQPTHPTTLDVVFAAGFNAGDVTIHGTAPDGTAITEVIPTGDGVTRNGTVVFALLDAVGAFTCDGGGTGSDLATIQSAGDLGLAEPNATVSKLSADGVNEAFAQAAGQITAGSVTPTTAKDGATVYEVWYAVDHTHVQNAHTHVQDAHTHVQDAHTHVQDAHTHTQTAHTHALS